MHKIDGVVVLYNPDETILKNINSYLDNIDILYIVDNSDSKNINLITKIKELSNKCKYINNNGNKGIAHALNIGAELAIEDGAEWLLTMDQDSSFSSNLIILEMRKWIQNNTSINIGIVSPFHDTIKENKEENKIVSYIEKKVVMTSGNLLNLNAYKKIGKFRENYFIDYVDYEYGLRLNRNNYKVIILMGIYLIHNLGDTKVKRIFSKNILYTNHNKSRRYYMTRNRLALISEYYKVYPLFCLLEIKQQFVGVLKILLFEENKREKIYYICLGAMDFFRNKMGKLNN